MGGRLSAISPPVTLSALPQKPQAPAKIRAMTAAEPAHRFQPPVRFTGKGVTLSSARLERMRPLRSAGGSSVGREHRAAWRFCISRSRPRQSAHWARWLWSRAASASVRVPSTAALMSSTYSSWMAMGAPPFLKWISHFPFSFTWTLAAEKSSPTAKENLAGPAGPWRSGT